MTTAPEIWDIILAKMPRGRWILLHDIYELIENEASLDSEDFYPQSPSSDIPKWKRNVRNVLQYRKKTRAIRWNGEARYLLD